MERVMYNTILGAKPLKADGRTFYYADCSFDGPQNVLEKQVAMLFGHVSADCGLTIASAHISANRAEST
jgi:hypothetical protein